MFNLLKEVLKEKEKSQAQDKKNELEEKIDEKQPVSKPDKWSFIGEQILTAFRDTYVSNPTEVTYQFSRKIADELVNGRYESDNDFFKEGVAITIYKGVENLIKKILTK